MDILNWSYSPKGGLILSVQQACIDICRDWGVWPVGWVTAGGVASGLSDIWGCGLRAPGCVQPVCDDSCRQQGAWPVSWVTAGGWAACSMRCWLGFDPGATWGMSRRSLPWGRWVAAFFLFLFLYQLFLWKKSLILWRI